RIFRRGKMLNPEGDNHPCFVLRRAYCVLRCHARRITQYARRLALAFLRKYGCEVGGFRVDYASTFRA
ncbi:MAG: hypothetical protein ACYTE3_24920, partial [Planctomycetota bacterium]